MAVLLSTLLSYGKLSANSELLALKSLGLQPLNYSSSDCSFNIHGSINFYFNDNLVPTSNKLAESTLRSGVGSLIKESKNNIIFSRKGSRIIPSTNKPTKINTYLTHIF